MCCFPPDGQLKLVRTANGDGGAQHATRVFEHEVHLFGRDFFGGHYDVAFVLAVFVVDYDYHFAGTNVGNGVGYIVKLYLLLHFSLRIFL